MNKDYAAFGMTLSSSFPLPGLAKVSDETLPICELSRQSPAALRAAWSGSASSSPWRGSLADGSELTIEWGVGGDLLFGYRGVDWFRLEPDGGRLGCAPSDPSAFAWRRVLVSRLLPLVALAHGYEALHAGAVETSGGVVGIVGPSGAGKSTLVGELLSRGHRLFADDVLVVESDGVSVRAHPASSHLSLADDRSSGPVGEVLGTFGGKDWIAVEGAAQRSGKVAAIIVLERRGEGLPEMRPIAASPLALAPFMLGLPDVEGRAADCFQTYSDLVESARLMQLCTGAAPPSELADEVEDMLGLRTSAIGGGAA